VAVYKDDIPLFFISTGNDHHTHHTTDRAGGYVLNLYWRDILSVQNRNVPVLHHTKNAVYEYGYFEVHLRYKQK